MLSVVVAFLSAHLALFPRYSERHPTLSDPFPPFLSGSRPLYKALTTGFSPY